MAYGDYGGWGYCHADRIDSCSDVVLTPRGTTSHPGEITLLTSEANGRRFHVLIGDPDSIRIGLYKQSSATILRKDVEIPLNSVFDPSHVDEDGDLDIDHAADEDQIFIGHVDGVPVGICLFKDGFIGAFVDDPEHGFWSGFSDYDCGPGLSRERSEGREAELENWIARQALEAEGPSWA